MTDPLTKKIMILEDEPVIAMSTEQALEDLGYQNVDTFYRLAPAVASAENTTYDLAILDVNIDKRQTSFDLARAMKAEGTVILFASGNSMNSAELLEIGSSLLSKPYSTSDLKTALEKLIAMS